MLGNSYLSYACKIYVGIINGSMEISKPFSGLEGLVVMVTDVC